MGNGCIVCARNHRNDDAVPGMQTRGCHADQFNGQDEKHHTPDRSLHCVSIHNTPGTHACIVFGITCVLIAPRNHQTQAHADPHLPQICERRPRAVLRPKSSAFYGFNPFGRFFREGTLR